MTKDNAIDVMQKVHEQLGTDIPFKLVEKCYEVEKKFLFEKDANKSLNMMKQIVEAHIDDQSN